jgi:hypothetical protein
MQETVPGIASYQNPDKSLNMHKLLSAFTQFFRVNSAMWLAQIDYPESAPHLLLMAYLQRVVNGGGKIHREYALGRKRVDLLVEFGSQRIIIEMKINRGKQTIPEGLEQTAGYMDTSNATEGHLLIFDQTPGKSWEEKIFTQEDMFDNKKITVWGL